MKICNISDTHNQHEVLDLSNYPADMLIHAGDITSTGSKREVTNFLTWFEKQDYKHKILVPGNHDMFIEDFPEDFKTLLAKYPSIICLQNSGTTIEGFKIWGSADTPEFCNWAFNKTEDELKETWAKVPTDTKILVTHGPAYGILDKVDNTWSAEQNVGCKILRETVLNADKLLLHVCGHIHEEGGTVELIGGTAFVNASVLDKRYRLNNEPVIITLKD